MVRRWRSASDVGIRIDGAGRLPVRWRGRCHLVERLGAERGRQEAVEDDSFQRDARQR